MLFLVLVLDQLIIIYPFIKKQKTIKSWNDDTSKAVIFVFSIMWRLNKNIEENFILRSIKSWTGNSGSRGIVKSEGTIQTKITKYIRYLFVLSAKTNNH